MANVVVVVLGRKRQRLRVFETTEVCIGLAELLHGLACKARLQCSSLRSATMNRAEIESKLAAELGLDDDVLRRSLAVEQGAAPSNKLAKAAGGRHSGDAEPGREDEEEEEVELPSQRLTIEMVKRRAEHILKGATVSDEKFTAGADAGNDEGDEDRGGGNSAGSALRKLMLLRVLRLDRERIANVDNLELFTEVHSLYLQHNRIETVEGLDCQLKLRFLALQQNKISSVPSLLHLSQLSVLDLSYNRWV